MASHDRRGWWRRTPWVWLQRRLWAVYPILRIHVRGLSECWPWFSSGLQRRPLCREQDDGHLLLYRCRLDLVPGNELRPIGRLAVRDVGLHARVLPEHGTLKHVHPNRLHWSSWRRKEGVGHQWSEHVDTSGEWRLRRAHLEQLLQREL